ncbi:GDSL-type esterase/lipase family protein [Glaciihabitans sp. UYNi722]|uniref:GDSL-type esterase/lipase family protein n=1 Tax=Glaciihabitans sp. UYNi722 TaxID=3156344 RepID=UPI003399E5F0
MAAYTPQGMFPRGALSGGGRLPAQIVLGVLAQESNLWQASRFTTPGETGNPLIGNYYGRTDLTAGIGDNSFWRIAFLADADCGYGVGQITDGMRLAGMEGNNPPALPVAQQRAIALDYTANISKVVQMLQDKWNESRDAGTTVNNGDPSKIENWFAAVWAYNSGFHPYVNSQTPWGLGWLNNPVNPVYNAGRHAFLDGNPADAAHPQLWPYPEKVMGFAANALSLVEHQTATSVDEVAAFRPATWNGGDIGGPANRTAVKPPLGTFCTQAVNGCIPGGTLQDPTCTVADDHCWWHGNATWKSNCADTCGLEFNRFTPAASYMAEQPNGTSFPANCGTTGLPAGALVIDDLPLVVNGTTVSQAPVRPGCAAVASSGTFALNFGTANSNGSHPSKIDLQQLGSGFNGHFYFTHTRNVDNPSLGSSVVGQWTLNQTFTNQWARVMVHTPDHAAFTQQAVYKVNTGSGTESRSLTQRTYQNQWRSIGVFQFNGQPSISLSNITKDGDGVDDIAWDAVAIQPLAAKPADFIVSMGDSYSSGEGAPSLSVPRYARDSDNNGNPMDTGPHVTYSDETAGNRFTDACHRSPLAWPRKAIVGASTTQSVGARADSLASDLDFHFTACSGATSTQMKAGNKGRFRELSQLDQGYLDANTTLVTLSIGGNDIGFGDVLLACVTTYFGSGHCMDQTPDGTVPLHQSTDLKINGLPSTLTPLLSQIQAKAPNAKILLMGYPPIFQSGGACVLIRGPEDETWLNHVSQLLNQTLQGIATSANTSTHPVYFGDPTNAFYNRGVCGTNPAINPLLGYVNGLEGNRTYGDQPMVNWAIPGPNFQLGVSQQSIHPSRDGTTLYAQVMQSTLAGNY